MGVNEIKLTEKESIVVNEIKELIANKIDIARKAYWRDTKGVASRTVYELRFTNPDLFGRINENIVRYLFANKYNVNWADVSRIEPLSESFIKEHYKRLSPTVILERYYDVLPFEVSQLFRPNLGVLNNLRYGFIKDDQLLTEWNSYGNTLKHKIKKYFKENPEKTPNGFKVFLMLN